MNQTTEDHQDIGSGIVGPYHSAAAHHDGCHSDPDLESIDNLRDRFLEAARHQGGVEALVRCLIVENESERAGEALVSLIAIIADARHPRLCAMALGWAAGIHQYQHKPAIELAKRNGVTKQAFCQLAAKLIKQLGLRRTRTMRSEAARRSMSKKYRERMRAKK